MPRQARVHVIKHSTIQLGDLIRVSGKLHDMNVSRTGTVAKRDNDGRGNVDYLTAKGVRLLTVYKDGSADMTGVKITRLQVGHENTLSGFDELLQTVAKPAKL
jgi:hypothetical protein